MSEMTTTDTSTTRDITEDIGRELKVNPPKVLARTAAKYGQARADKQRVAILLSKSRKAGARIPQSRRSH